MYWLLALAALIALPALAAPTFPALTGRVVDEAGVLSPAAKTQITGWLAQFEAATKRQVVVATVKSLQGLPIEDYGYQLGRFWGIGEKGKNTGAILLVAPTEHKVRIEVGYGLEGELTDAVSSAIINQDILPQFRQGDYPAGIAAGTAAILRTLGWHGASAAIPPPPRQRPARSAGFIPFLLIFIAIWVFAWRMSRHRARAGYGSGVGPFIAGSLLGGSLGGGGFGFGGGGGGFGGGGGSFGGGGASGSW